jgi:DNA-binding transcriptional ArsR family regulator
VLTIQFSKDDLARVRIATRPDPLWELVLAVRLLRQRPHSGPFAAWYGQVTHQLKRANPGEQLALLRALLPQAGYFPDFLNPIDAADGLDHGLEAIRCTGRSRLRRDIRQLASTRHLPPAARGIAEGSKEELGALTDTMRFCYDVLVRPYEQDIAVAFDCDRRRRLDALAKGGVDGLFDSLRPFACWMPDVLCVPNHRKQDLRLNGRGLLLIPAAFSVTRPVTLFDSDLPPVLIYPTCAHLNPSWPDSVGIPAPLLSLIGATRAEILHVVDRQARVMSAELASQVGISMASTSEQTKILREAGLITSDRERSRLFHQLTPLGRALLARARPPTVSTKV